MLRFGGPRCPPVLLLLLLLVVVVVVASGRGAQECLGRAVSTAGELELRPERRGRFPHLPREWKSVDWKVKTDEGKWKRILTAWKDGGVSYTNGSPGGVVFQPETLSLRISPVRKEDRGVYKVEFEDPSGIVTHLSFCVSVWDPIPWVDLQAQALPWEQGWCNISLTCSVPAAGNVSYSWKCSGDPPGALGHPQPRLFLQIPVDGGPTICLCNVSNPVSWSSASADIVALCRQSDLSPLVLWSAVASALGLSLLLLVVTCCWWRKRRKSPPEAPPGPVEEPLTIYEEVGSDKTSQDPNGNFEAPQAPNTVYAVVCPTTQQEDCRYQQQPGSCTIYPTAQLGRRPPSLRRKRLDPALVSTAYLEDLGGPPPWRHSLRTPHPPPAGLHLS